MRHCSRPIEAVNWSRNSALRRCRLTDFSAANGTRGETATAMRAACWNLGQKPFLPQLPMTLPRLA